LPPVLEKKNYVYGEKFILKNHLIPTSFDFEVSLENQQKSGNDIKNVSKWYKTWNIIKVSKERASLKREMELRPRISKFSIFLLI
jgi:hypothetical protein